MPKTATYRADAIVYFIGDPSDKIFFIQAGEIRLDYHHPETGKPVQERVKAGDFLGVRSTFGHYPRLETATAISDSQIFIFTVAEFDTIALEHPNIAMKMLKVFSSQLRELNKRVSSLLKQEAGDDPITGLFNLGQFYLNESEYQQAQYVFQRFIDVHSTDSRVPQAQEALEKIQKALAQIAAPVIDPATAIKKKMSAALDLQSAGNYDEAMAAFKEISGTQTNPEITIDAFFQVGVCLNALAQTDAAIKHFTQFITNYANHKKYAGALLELAKAHSTKGENDKAKEYYEKIVQLENADPNIVHQAQVALGA